MASDPASDANPEDFEPVTVDSDDVTVEKAATWYTDEALQVTITVESRRDEPVEVRLVDHLPADDGPVEVEFHPHYDPKHWTRSTPRDVVYEVILAPTEQRETVYGFKARPDGDLHQVQEPPTVEVTPVDRLGADIGEDDISNDSFDWDGDADSSVENGTAPESTADGAAARPDAATADDDGGAGESNRPEPRQTAQARTEPAEPVSSGEGVGMETPGHESANDFYRGSSASAAGGTQSAGPATSPDPDAAHPDPDDDGEVDSRVDNPPAAGSAGGVDSVAESLEAALEAGALDEEDLDELRSQLGLSGPTRQLEHDLDDLRETVEDLTSVRDTLDELTDQREDMSAALDEFRAELQSAKAERAGLADDLADLTELVETVDAIEGRLESLHDRVETTQSTVAGLEDRHAAEVGRLGDRLDALQRDLEDANNARQTEIEMLRGDIREWERWREQFTEAIQTDPSSTDTGSDSIFGNE